MIYAVRTTLGREASVVENIARATRKFSYAVYSAFVPKDVKGYVFVEAQSLDDVRSAVAGIHNARGVVDTPVEMKDVETAIESKQVEITLKKGDLVEIVGDPFRGEKAKVIRVDSVKREATVEMIEAAIPIPTTLPIETLRLIKSSE
ncbi:MAG TPA: transcription elongation factor Spt5 [archaeon]|nr:transcription elongation factor Spt5 [archaeon]